MFLICNLILAFLANTTSSSSDYFDYFQSQFSNDFVVDIEDEHNKLQVKKKQEEFYEQLVSSEEEGSSENEAAIDEEEEESSENEAAIEEEEEEELRDINTDELNRKFEEFIRKMKKEIMIEPKTHPIAI
ncbi:unnamed protein product [Vicia faba]|uniref:Uncharacterized protein n=1 Tax=Vicia faba TaxID=3906 RepID=A0AAV1ANH3_VICFA|nr:unnamed protein product [Vicia faba]